MRIGTFLAGLCAGAAVFGAASASATTGLQDGSFELIGQSIGDADHWAYIKECGDASYPSSTCTWQGSSAGVQGDDNSDWPGASASIAAEDGSYYAMIQDVSVLAQIFVAGATGEYRLSWSDAGRGVAYPGIDGNQQYDVAIFSGPTLGNVQTIFSGTTTTGQLWHGQSSGNFDLIAGQAYMLAFLGNSSGDHTAYIDNVRMILAGGDHSSVGAVPEPASWALMVGGFGLVGGAMRRRKATLRFA